jgi:formylmethanofuran dehydrogenase subunit B
MDGLKIMKVSNCCGAEMTDEILCPSCQDDCDWVDYDSNDDDIYNNFCHEGGIKYER